MYWAPTRSQEVTLYWGSVCEWDSGPAPEVVIRGKEQQSRWPLSKQCTQKHTYDHRRRGWEESFSRNNRNCVWRTRHKGRLEGKRAQTDVRRQERQKRGSAFIKQKCERDGWERRCCRLHGPSWDLHAVPGGDALGEWSDPEPDQRGLRRMSVGWACVSTRQACRVTKSAAFLSYKRVREVQGERSKEMKNWRCRRLME